MLELGILVWQDFQFACGVYPAHDEFVANVKMEAEANVTRLRHHASMAIWCGNNEGMATPTFFRLDWGLSVGIVVDYQQVLQWGGKVILARVE